jgi:type II secretory pathway component PulF
MHSARLSASELSKLCHRLAVETESGIDIRRTWQREAESAGSRSREAFAHVRDAVARGDSLTRALAGTGRLLPPLMLEMVQVGEQTGTLANVFHRLSAHYRSQTERQRMFLIAIAWPMIQLIFAVFVIGLLIWILGIVAERNGQPIDILGFGLVGTRGLVIYANFVIAVTLCVAGVIYALRRGVLWTKPLQRAAMRIPLVGASLEKLALAQLTWVLQLTMNVAMDVRRVVPLALRATGNNYYIQHTDQIVSLVAQGHPLHEAFAATGAFPGDFIDSLEVAEESGKLVDSLDKLSRRYEEEAKYAMGALSMVLAVLVWGAVGGLLTWMIFRLFGFYVGTINDAVNMTR